MYLCLCWWRETFESFLSVETDAPHAISPAYHPLLLYSLFMLSLFVVELSSFITSTTHSTVVVDFNRDQQVRSSEV